MTDRDAAAVAAARNAGRQAAATLPPITDPAVLVRLRALLLPGARALTTRSGADLEVGAATRPFPTDESEKGGRRERTTR